MKHPCQNQAVTSHYVFLHIWFIDKILAWNILVKIKLLPHIMCSYIYDLSTKFWRETSLSKSSCYLTLCVPTYMIYRQNFGVKYPCQNQAVTSHYVFLHIWFIDKIMRPWIYLIMFSFFRNWLSGGFSKRSKQRFTERQRRDLLLLPVKKQPDKYEPQHINSRQRPSS